MIISIIETIVNSLTSNGITFIFGHGPDYFRNLDLDEVAFSSTKGVVYLDQPIENDYQLTQGGYIGEEYTITLMFMFKSQLDWTPAEHDSNAIQPANNAIRQFISVCQSSGLIDEVSGTSGLEFINLLDVNVSGKSLTITLKPTINASVCIQ